MSSKLDRGSSCGCAHGPLKCRRPQCSCLMGTSATSCGACTTPPHPPCVVGCSCSTAANAFAIKQRQMHLFLFFKRKRAGFCPSCKKGRGGGRGNSVGCKMLHVTRHTSHVTGHLLQATANALGLSCRQMSAKHKGHTAGHKQNLFLNPQPATSPTPKSPPPQPPNHQPPNPQPKPQPPT